jgi:hypothetical protein
MWPPHFPRLGCACCCTCVLTKGTTCYAVMESSTAHVYLANTLSEDQRLDCSKTILRMTWCWRRCVGRSRCLGLPLLARIQFGG